MARTDVHQHFWTEPLLDALAARQELPFVRSERGLTVLYLAGERPYVIDSRDADPARRAEALEQDRLDGALVCLSSPIGIERLPRAQSVPLLNAYHEGALSLGGPFGVWGAIALDRPDPDDVDAALELGCVGISLPAGALAGVEELAHMRPVLARLQAHDAPLFVHPGPGITAPGLPAEGGCSLSEPLWWPALTSYVSGLQAAWLAFRVAGRAEHPRLRVVFAMLAGLAPLQCERLGSRGGPAEPEADAQSFYETSSYGPRAARAMSEVVGAGQIIYGSDRPVVEPGLSGASDTLDWALVAEGTARALGSQLLEVAR
jgi:6-methylsalicylate decarboxylase